MIRRILITLLILLTFFIPSLIYAQSTLDNTATDKDTLESTSDLFTVELIADTQSPWTKSVPLIIKFRSNIDANRVEISWDAPAGVKITRSHPQFISVKKDQVYVYKAKLKPETSGLYNIAGNVTIWEHNTNYTTSSSINIRFDQDLMVSPQSAGYTGALIIKYITIFIIILIASTVIILGIKYLFKYLKEWLKPPE